MHGSQGQTNSDAAPAYATPLRVPEGPAASRADAAPAPPDERERLYLDLLLGLSGSLEPAETLQRVTDVAARLLGADSAIVATPAESGDLLALRAQSGTVRADVLQLPMDDRRSLCVRAYHSGTIEREADFAATDSPYARRSGDSVVGPCVAIPVPADGGIAAVLTVARLRGRPDFDAGCLRDAALLATQAAQAVRNARLYAEARAASEAKTRFLSTMSHELRTPLTAIDGFLSLLELEVAGPLVGEQREYVARARRAGQHLIRIIEDVLDLARVERGRVLVRARPFALVEPLVQAADVVRPQLRRNVSLQLSPGTGLHAVGDEDRVRQILINLLGNAAKFTERGVIAIEGEAAGDRVLVRVRDTGPGIAREHLSRLFEPFYRVNDSLTGAAGTGLGLAVSRQLALAMHGELDVESTPGEGSTFTLSLPRAPGNAPDRA